MNSDRTAVLITCHNRKPKTLACLAALFNQELSPEVTIDVYLVDDGSTDGTAEAVHQAYPQVKILQGDGSLFWNRGMRKAFAEALISRTTTITSGSTMTQYFTQKRSPRYLFTPSELISNS
jgi:GT2 family glycosyltransferase